MYLSKIDGTTIDDAEDLDLVMPMYNLTEYSLNYSETTGSVCFFYKNEANNFNVNIADNAVFKSFMYKTKLVEKSEVQPASNNKNRIVKNATTPAPLK